MAITLVVNGTERTVESGATLEVSPSDRVQVRVNGQVIDPAAILRDVNAADVILTLPDGQVVRLGGFVDLAGRMPPVA